MGFYNLQTNVGSHLRREPATARKRERRSPDLPTLGEINRAIDKLFHRHFHKGPLPIIADTFAHALVEQDPRRSYEKFVEHNLGPLVREVLKLVRAEKERGIRRTLRSRSSSSAGT